MIQSIRLQNFRSYEDMSFEFSDGVNIIVGPNTSGKTNLLEAILVISRGSSYRANDADLIKHKSKWARLDAWVPKHRMIKLQTNLNKQVEKLYEFEGKKSKKINTENSIPYVLFEPNNLLAISTTPSERREFIDNMLIQTDNNFADVKKRYTRVLLQRNALLKKPKILEDEMFVWNIRLAEFGGIIAEARHQLIEKLHQDISYLYSEFAGNKNKVHLDYLVPIGRQAYAGAFLKALENRLKTDQQRGFTSVGPHREDIIIKLNNNDVQLSASRGETRTLLLALKVAEAKLVFQLNGQKPLLLLDDVFSELDGARRQALTHALKDHQVFITTTDADVVVQHFTNDCTIIPLTKK
ncbi:MAG: DNA replication/repair protein RecF [Patescibacteria group bacterium]